MVTEYTKCKNNLMSLMSAMKRMIKKKDCYDFSTIIGFYDTFSNNLDNLNSQTAAQFVGEDHVKFINEMEEFKGTFYKFIVDVDNHLEKFGGIIDTVKRDVRNAVKIVDRVCKDIVDKCDGDVVLSGDVVDYHKKDIEFVVGFLDVFGVEIDRYKSRLDELVVKAKEVGVMLDKYAKDKGN